VWNCLGNLLAFLARSVANSCPIVDQVARVAKELVAMAVDVVKCVKVVVRFDGTAPI